MNDNRIAVLLTVHNRKEKTLNCLRNLFNQSLPESYSMNVFLTNDGCTDGTVETIQKEYPHVSIINGDGNLFWNRGMHAAWSEAEKQDFDFYLWLNDDTFLYGNAINQLLNISSRKNDKAIIVGSTCSHNDRCMTTYGGRDKKGALIEPSDITKNCMTCNGNILLIPKHVYNILGKNDPVFHHSLGDFDYGFRATKNNIILVIAPGYLGECELHDSIEKWKNPKVPFKIRWKNFISPTGANPFEFFIYKRRHYGLLPAMAIFISNFIHVCLPFMWKKDI